MYISFLIVTIGWDLLYPCTTAMHVIVIFYDFIFLPLYLLFGSFLRFVRISASVGVVGWRFGTTKTCWKSLSGPKPGCYSVAGSELPFIVHSFPVLLFYSSLFLCQLFSCQRYFVSFHRFIIYMLSFIWLIYLVYFLSSIFPLLYFNFI